MYRLLKEHVAPIFKAGEGNRSRRNVGECIQQCTASHHTAGLYNSHTTPDRLILFLPDPCWRSLRSAVPWLRLYAHVWCMVCVLTALPISSFCPQLHREPDSSLTPPVLSLFLHNSEAIKKCLTDHEFKSSRAAVCRPISADETFRPEAICRPLNLQCSAAAAMATYFTTSTRTWRWLAMNCGAGRPYVAFLMSI